VKSNTFFGEKCKFLVGLSSLIMWLGRLMDFFAEILWENFVGFGMLIAFWGVRECSKNHYKVSQLKDTPSPLFSN
jgi:hypothetical protein